jgi:hypothetical protein
MIYPHQFYSLCIEGIVYPSFVHISLLQVQLLSPVPTEFSELSQMIESSVVDEPSFQQLGCSSSVVVSLRDEVANRFSVVSGLFVRFKYIIMLRSSIVVAIADFWRNRNATILGFCELFIGLSNGSVANES